MPTSMRRPDWEDPIGACRRHDNKLKGWFWRVSLESKPQTLSAAVESSKNG